MTGLRAEIARAVTDLDAIAANIDTARARLAQQAAQQGWEIGALAEVPLATAQQTARRVSSTLQVAARTWGGAG